MLKMAAPIVVHSSGSNMEKDGNIKPFTQENSNHQQTTCVSNQLLYPETYGESYQAEKLTVIGKKNSTPAAGGLKTVDVPQSSVLSRIKRFLPELSVANKDLALELANHPDRADRFNIEHLEESESLHVEMNLSLIPPELLGDDESTSDDSFSESESESEADTEHQENEDFSLGETKCTLKLHPTSGKQVKPNIVMIDDVQSDNCRKENITDR